MLPAPRAGFQLARSLLLTGEILFLSLSLSFMYCGGCIQTWRLRLIVFQPIVFTQQRERERSFTTSIQPAWLLNTYLCYHVRAICRMAVRQFIRNLYIIPPDTSRSEEFGRSLQQEVAQVIAGFLLTIKHRQWLTAFWSLCHMNKRMEPAASRKRLKY